MDLREGGGSLVKFSIKFGSNETKQTLKMRDF